MTSLISNAAARTATSVPMSPNPMIPRVRPASPCALPYSFLRHRPDRRSATASGMRRSMAVISPIVSSATATAFFPGVLHT